MLIIILWNEKIKFYFFAKKDYLIWINCVNHQILVYKWLLFKHSLCRLIIKSGKWSTSLVWSLRSRELDSKTLNDSHSTIHWMVIIHLHKNMALKTYIYTHRKLWNSTHDLISSELLIYNCILSVVNFFSIPIFSLYFSVSFEHKITFNETTEAINHIL